VFLPLVVLAYYFRAHSPTWREWSLLVVSLMPLARKRRPGHDDQAAGSDGLVTERV
jgi:hypothetical protein